MVEAEGPEHLFGSFYVELPIDSLEELLQN